MKISEAINNGKPCWRVSWQENGDTRRAYFPTKGEAQTFGNDTERQIREKGEEWVTLPPGARAKLMSVWAMSQAGGYDLVDACRDYEATGNTLGRVTMAKLCASVIEAKLNKGVSSDYLRIFQGTTDLFCATHGEKRADQITTTQIREWLSTQTKSLKWGPHSRRHAITNLNTVFNWGMRDTPPAVKRNPAAAIERPVIKYQRAAILTPARAWDVLQLCMAKHPTALPWLAIGLFAGVRDAEISRLTWEDIREKHIDVIGKNNDRRPVPIQPALAAFLAKCTTRGTGLVCPPNHQWSSDLRKEAGGWPKNALRHSYITYEVARSQSKEATAIAAGNSVQMIKKHYDAVTTPEVALEFWSIRPDSARPGSNIIPMVQAIAAA